LKFNDPELRKHIEESLRLVDSMEERKFAGSWLMVVVLGFFYIIPGGPLVVREPPTRIFDQQGLYATTAVQISGGPVVVTLENIGLASL
jgi:hypothetical protein